MKIALPKPIEWEGLTYAEINLDLDGLTGRDLLAVRKELRVSGVRDILQAETDERYLVAVACKAGHLPAAVLEAAPAKVFVRVTAEVQAFLLGASGEV